MSVFRRVGARPLKQKNIIMNPIQLDKDTQAVESTTVTHTSVESTTVAKAATTVTHTSVTTAVAKASNPGVMVPFSCFQVLCNFCLSLG